MTDKNIIEYDSLIETSIVNFYTKSLQEGYICIYNETNIDEILYSIKIGTILTAIFFKKYKQHIYFSGNFKKYLKLRFKFKQKNLRYNFLNLKHKNININEILSFMKKELCLPENIFVDIYNEVYNNNFSKKG